MASIAREHLEGSDGFCKGYLYKRRGGFAKHLPNAWQPRYVVVDSGVLRYYDDEEKYEAHGESRGWFDLKANNFELISGSQLEGSPSLYTLQLVPSDPAEEKWKMCANNKADHMKFLFAIEHALEKKLGHIRPREIEGYTSDFDPADDEEFPVKAKRKPSIDETIMAKNRGELPKRKDNRGKAKGGKRKGLQLRKAEPWITRGSAETALTALIVNTCFYFSAAGEVHVAARVFYLVLANVVIFRTLSLRAARLTRAKLELETANETLSDMVSEEEEKEGQIQAKSTQGSVRQSVYVKPGTKLDLGLGSYRAESSGDDEVVRTHRRTSSGGMSSKLVRSISNSFKKGGASSSNSDANPGIRDSAGDLNNIGATAVESDDEVDVVKAGSTFLFDAGTAPNVAENTWSLCDHRHFQLRQVGYAKTKQKAASGKPFYEPATMDVFCMDKRLDHVAAVIQSPKIQDVLSMPCFDKEKHPDVFVKPLFCFQMQLPADPPPMFATCEDGPGWAICVFFKLSKESCTQLEHLATAPPGLRLLNTWCEKCATDQSYKARFKVICSALNLAEMGVSSVIQSYNAKPVLIRRTSSIFFGDDYLELDIHVYKFANLAKQPIHMLSQKCSNMFMELGILIEGRADDELPEQLIGCVGCNKPKEDMLEYMFPPE